MFFLIMLSKLLIYCGQHDNLQRTTSMRLRVPTSGMLLFNYLKIIFCSPHQRNLFKSILYQTEYDSISINSTSPKSINILPLK